MASPNPSRQGAREVYGSVGLETPNGDSAMDETNDAVRVNVVAGAGSGGTAATDDSAFTVGSGSGTPIMGYAAADNVDAGDVGVVRMTVGRALFVNLRDSSGTELSVGGGTQYNEDDAHNSGDKVTMAGAVRKDTAASLAGTDGDITIPIVDSSGRLWVNASGAAVPVTDNAGSLTVDGTVSITANSSVNVNQLAGTTTDTNSGVKSAGTLRVVVATDQPQLTNALKVDGSAVTQPVSGTVSITANSSVNVNQLAGTGVAVNSGNLSAGVQRVTLATDQVQLTNALKVDGSAVTQPVSQATASNLNAQVVGSIAHDGVDSGNPVKVGYKAVAHGSNPTAVAAADRSDAYCNRHGIPFQIGGHPNVIRAEWTYTTAPSNDTALVTVGAGNKIVVTMCSAFSSANMATSPGVRIGLATATLSAASTTAVTGMVLSHAGIAAGSGVVEGNGSGIVAVGADNEDLRIQTGTITTGTFRVLCTYYVIES